MLTTLGAKWRTRGLSVLLLGTLALGATGLGSRLMGPSAQAAMLDSAQTLGFTQQTDLAQSRSTPTPTAITEQFTASITRAVVAGVHNAQVWNDAGELVLTAETGTRLTAVGRSDDATWLAVEDENATGWVLTEQVIAFDLIQLPPLELPAALVDLPSSLTADDDAVAETEPDATATMTATAIISGSAVITPTATITGSEEGETTTITATVTTTNARLNVRAGPGTNYPIVAKALTGEEYLVLGINEAGDWWQIELPAASGGFGWVAAAYLETEGDVTDLPVTTTISAQPAPSGAASASASTTVTETTVMTDSAGSAPSATAVSSAAATNVGTVAGLSGTIVFQQSIGGMIYAYRPATGQLWPLTNGADPAISPDGQVVAFVRDGGENGIYLIDIDGSNERMLFSERNRVMSPKWSPDGTSLVFTRGDSFIDCYQLSRTQCLTEGEMKRRFPGGIPDDLEAPLVKEYSYRLAAIDANGENYRDVPALTSAKAPDWNDQGIVYQSTAGIQRTDDANVDTQEVAFDRFKPFYNDPDWQPAAAGGQIAFQVQGAAQWEVYVVNPDGSGMTAITRPVTTLVDEMPSNLAPAYSPDGRYIVFLSNRQDNNEAGAWRLWVMNADGSNQQLLPIEVSIDYTYGLEQVASWGG